MNCDVTNEIGLVQYWKKYHQLANFSVILENTFSQVPTLLMLKNMRFDGSINKDKK